MKNYKIAMTYTFIVESDDIDVTVSKIMDTFDTDFIPEIIEPLELVVGNSEELEEE